MRVRAVHVLLATVACAATARAAPSAPPAAPPCAACAAVQLGEADVARVAASDVRIDGLSFVIDGGAAPRGAADLAARGAHPWVVVPAGSVPTSAGLAGAAGAWLRVSPALDAAQAIYAVRTAATALRADYPAIAVGVMLTAALATADAARAIAPYLDAVLVPDTGGARPADAAARFPGLALWIDSSGTSADIPRPAGTETVIVHPPPDDLLALVGRLSGLREWMPQGLSPLDDVQLACEGCRTLGAWLNPDSLDAIVRAEVPAAGASALVQPGAASVHMFDLGVPAPPLALAVATAPSGAARVQVPPSSGRVVLRVSGWRGTGDIYRSDVSVRGARTLTVDEIIARHQAQRARQAAVVDSDVATGTTVLTFDVPGFAGPVTVEAQTTIFTRGSLVEIAQQAVTVNGVSLAVGAGRPRLPLIEPERVSTPPLTITLTSAYTYRLAGRARVDGRDAYVVDFSPTAGRGAALGGRAWIDSRTFALVRLDASETRLRGAIVSSEQQDEYGPFDVRGREVWLLVRSRSFQMYQGAGVRTPMHQVNAPGFEERLAQAHASTAVMLRDTPDGYRYLVPAPASAAAGGPTRVVAPRAGTRVVTLAFGVIDDPNITVPLPYAGLSYLDFDFLQKGIQLSAFYGGAYGQVAWTVPHVFGRRWQLTGQAFGIAARYNDRSFRNGIEQYAENIEQRPFRADATLVVPIASRAQVRAGYELEYTSFRAGPDTAATFVVPTDEIVHAARIALDVQRGPWSALLWWNPARRQGWRPWGRPGSDAAPGTSDFERYGLTLGRSWVMRPGAVARLEASWMDGHDLDRFSRYTVDSFQNQLHGYPSASLRFDRGGLVRTAATWTPVPRARLDVFADAAAVRDPGFGRGLRWYPGVGTAVEVPLPRRFLVAVEWGYGFRGRTSAGGTGTQVVKVTGVKMF